MITAKQKRIRKHRLIWGAVSIALATPLIMVLIVGTALRMGASL